MSSAKQYRVQKLHSTYTLPFDKLCAGRPTPGALSAVPPLPELHCQRTNRAGSALITALVFRGDSDAAGQALVEDGVF